VAGLLAGSPLAAALRAVVDLGWTARPASLPYELVHGTLRRPAA
jgi:hypothetical protein